ncbi:hypothetical protein J5N97_024691 [Dioscorea zingiberensis]|uniref:DUF4378 domain-containing protein n=1 Tax=Dioscorea zingiberensis TaxID=325984 RepID=A0A9D5H8Z4_9LILI|nr:hypothetical protein J5N97_024691 [Dioscorea zingiberensis]
MGRMLQVFEYNQANTSRKLFRHKKHHDDLEAPRNSLEFTIEPPQTYHVLHEDIPYSCQVKQKSSKSIHCPNGATMKKLITDDEMSKILHAKRNAPGVVARLMGVDTGFPSVESINEKPSSSTPDISLLSTSSEQMNQELVRCYTKLDSDQSRNFTMMTKLWPREHPQEELLQKFKKEFEACQASKSQQQTRSLHLDRNLLVLEGNQSPAQENLTILRMARHMETKRTSVPDKLIKSRSHLLTRKTMIDDQQGNAFQYKVKTSKKFGSNVEKKMAPKRRVKPGRDEYLAVTKFDKKQEISSSPTRIVVLKPSIESVNIGEEGNMEDFLREVKERLRLEIQGKTRNSSTARGIFHEASFGESSNDSKNIAQHIAKKIKENVTREISTTLKRSESTRSCRSEIQINALDSLKFINRDTRKYITERLKNVLKNQEDVQDPLPYRGRSEGLRLEVMPELSETGTKLRNWEEKRSVDESKSLSFRCKRKIKLAFKDEQLSPMNLVRSYSAPARGTAFGKLLLEDQYVITGAHIHKKQESSEQNSPQMRKRKKDSFSIKGRVLNLKQNLILKRKLFAKKLRSIDKSTSSIVFESLNPIVIAPSVVMNFGTVQDNHTEVPPSPASMSSSHPSPLSPLEAPFTEEPHSSPASNEFSSVFSEMTIGEHQPSYEDEQVELRDNLITAGLCEGRPLGQTLLSRETIPRWLSQKMEEKYNWNGREIGINHSMLLDLVNEMIQSCKVPQGKRLLDVLWHELQMNTSTGGNESDSLESIVAFDLKLIPWSSLCHEVVNLVGREMELLIFGELIDEFVCAFFCN